MRLVTLRTAAGTRAAIQVGDEFQLLRFGDVGELLAIGPSWATQVEPTGEKRPVETADLAPVIPRPEKILCVGRNFLAHAQERGNTTTEQPTLFAKYSRTLIGPQDDLSLPDTSEEVDWEAELAVIVGAEAYRVSEHEAEDLIAGFSVLNDVSMRDWQHRTPQWFQGKNFERTTPLGPALVTRDEIQHLGELIIRCEVDSEVVQEAALADMVFSPAHVISYASSFIRLMPGDVLAMGTPAGIGAARTPPRFLRSGQVLRTSITGLGACENVCTEMPTQKGLA